MSLTYVFPGQGSQYPGMTEKVIAVYPEAEALFREADCAFNFGLYDLARQGSTEELTRTENAQPAILMVSVAWAGYLSKLGIAPDYVCGHSLGEFSALVVAGVLEFTEALQLVRRRGELMRDAARTKGGGMVAIVGLTAHTVQRIVRNASEFGVIEIANWNSPDQLVLSGEMGALAKAQELSLLAGARIARSLPVSAPFHSSLMRTAALHFHEDLFKVTFRDARAPVLVNVGPQLLQDGEEIRQALGRQMERPVLWEACIRHLVEIHVDTFREVGPKNVLTALIRNICPAVEAEAIEKLAEGGKRGTSDARQTN
jgi:[acyl-carrier-protein] S-malonyltransferase